MCAVCACGMCSYAPRCRSSRPMSCKRGRFRSASRNWRRVLPRARSARLVTIPALRQPQVAPTRSPRKRMPQAAAPAIVTAIVDRPPPAHLHLHLHHHHHRLLTAVVVTQSLTRLIAPLLAHKAAQQVRAFISMLDGMCGRAHNVALCVHYRSCVQYLYCIHCARSAVGPPSHSCD